MHVCAGGVGGWEQARSMERAALFLPRICTKMGRNCPPTADSLCASCKNKAYFPGKVFGLCWGTGLEKDAALTRKGGGGIGFIDLFKTCSHCLSTRSGSTRQQMSENNTLEQLECCRLYKIIQSKTYNQKTQEGGLATVDSLGCDKRNYKDFTCWWKTVREGGDQSPWGGSSKVLLPPLRGPFLGMQRHVWLQIAGPSKAGLRG